MHVVILPHHNEIFLKMKKEIFALSLLLLLLSGCLPDDPGYEFEYDTIITETPVNLEKINTEFDDYNSDLPYIYGTLPLIFSSNRNSNGENFDFVFKRIEISYHEKDDALNFSFPIYSESEFIDSLFKLVNTEGDELGPLSYNDEAYDFFMYASNPEGHYNINFVYTPRSDWGTYAGKKRLYGPFDASAINSDADELYPAFDLYGNLYFCSNRDTDNFSIYSVVPSADLPLHAFFETDQEIGIEKLSILSSDSNDKCPSIYGDFMVFASDREGGYGGFDLYYSVFSDEQWSQPQNFGSQINTEHDEYRPITFDFAGYKIMIFSSNRPGGKGGFDLYSVVINNHIADFE